MRLMSILFQSLSYRVHNIPYRYRGKNRIKRKPSMKDILIFKNDLEREERNMLLLRHPYLTKEQSHGHMKEAKEVKKAELDRQWQENRNVRFNKCVTIADRLNHLRVKEVWD